MKEIRFFVTLCFDSEDGQRRSAGLSDERIEQLAQDIGDGIEDNFKRLQNDVKCVYIEEQFSNTKVIVNL
jgi:hypothetical protein